MTFLVDANILSEVTKPHPSAKVQEWLQRNEQGMVVDPIILGEIQFGILRMPTGQKKRLLRRWFNEVVANIACLPWEAATAMHWAKLLVQLRQAGKAMPIKDSMIASTALAHGLIMVTRNESDFEKAKISVVNPFA